MNDDDLRSAIAFALRRHIRPKRIEDADLARQWAAKDVLDRLRLCGYEVRKIDRPVVLPRTP